LNSFLEVNCKEDEADEACIERYFRENPEQYDAYQKYVSEFYNNSVENHLMTVQNTANNKIYDLAQAFDHCSDQVNNQLIAENNQLGMQLNLYNCVQKLGFLKEMSIIDTSY
jgi:hypothetical protein